MLESIAAHLDQIAQLAPTWGLVLVFVFMAIESSFIPFPSEVVMIPAGFLAARGELISSSCVLGLVLAIVAGILGSLAGAFANYYLALWAGKPFLEKYGKYFFIKRQSLDKACEVFNKYGAMTTFVCRLIPVIRQLISIPAGISRMQLGSFAFYTGLGAGIWTSILAITGYAIGLKTSDVPYSELVVRGKDAAAEYMPMIIAVALIIVALHIIVSKKISSKN